VVFNYTLFNGVISNSDNMASSGKTTVKMNSKISERKRTSLNIRYYTGGGPGGAEEDGVPAEIRTRHLQNRRQKYFRVRQIVQFLCHKVVYSGTWVPKSEGHIVSVTFEAQR
jgi:hypothetical protein